MTNPAPKLGPVSCQGCGTPVYWVGRYRYNRSWKEAGQRRGQHRCFGPLCGAALRTRERCARRVGHTSEHRTAYSLENARVARSGISRARAKGYNGATGSSGESNTIADGTRVLATTQDAGVIAFRGSSS